MKREDQEYAVSKLMADMLRVLRGSYEVTQRRAVSITNRLQQGFPDLENPARDGPVMTALQSWPRARHDKEDLHDRIEANVVEEVVKRTCLYLAERLVPSNPGNASQAEDQLTAYLTPIIRELADRITTTTRKE